MGDLAHAFDPPSPAREPDYVLSIVDYEIRCTGHYKGGTCNRLLAEMAARPWRMTCGRCKTVNESVSGIVEPHSH